MWLPPLPRGATQEIDIRGGGGQSKNFAGNPTILAHFPLDPKISTLLMSCTLKYRKLQFLMRKYL